MKRTITILAIVLTSANSFEQAPVWSWANSAGGTTPDRGNSVSADASGNVFMTGYFNSPTITFGTTTLTNEGNTNIYIAKYDTDGNVLWAKSAGGTLSDGGNSVSTDASGNVFMTGYFSSAAITFGTTTLTNAGAYSVFIVKYDADGTVLWAESAGGTSSDYGTSVSTDASGNVFITGYFSSPTINFGTTTLTNAGNNDIFIVKYDADGTVLWAESAGGTSSDAGASVSTDASGSVFVTGEFSSPTITFGTTTLTNAGNTDVFIVKYGDAGTALWAKSADCTSFDGGTGVSTDASGNVYMTGYFNSPAVTFGTTTLTNAGLYNIFIVKYDAAGTVLWAESAGGTSSDFGYSVAAADGGYLFITGLFSSPTINFGTTTLPNSGSASTNDIFIAQYDAAGTVIWAASAGATFNDVGYSVSVDASGSVFVTGEFTSPAINFGSTTLTNSGVFDIFIVKLNTTAALEEMQNENGIIISPNPSSGKCTIEAKGDFEIYTLMGQKVWSGSNNSSDKMEIDLSGEAKGIYVLRIKSGAEISAQKIIIH